MAAAQPYPAAPADVIEESLALYRDLHAHPELSGEEHRTQAAVRMALEESGAEVSPCGGTGLVAVLRNGDGPTVAMRADLDALPLTEATGLPYASTVPGVMHACGHDVHTASLVGALLHLDRNRSTWAGTVVGVFQPAEENGAGALAMLDDGVFDATGLPDVVYGMHVAAAPLGRLVCRPGWYLSAHRSWKVTVRGVGGSGCRPHLARDVVVAAASMVLRLQTLVSREADPFRMVVLTVGDLHAGAKASVIPAEATFTVSSHTYEPEVAERLREGVHRVLRAEAMASEVEVDIVEDAEITGIPAVWNDPAEHEGVVEALGAVFGADAVAPPRDPLPASDDFGRYGDRLGVPSVIYNFGVQDPALHEGPEPAPRNHDARFAPHPTGAVNAGVAAALAVLGHRLRRPADAPLDHPDDRAAAAAPAA